MKNLRNVARKYGARIVTAAAVTAPAFSFAADPVLDAVDFTSIATWVSGVGVLIVGIAVAFKGIALAKRAVSKV